MDAKTLLKERTELFQNVYQFKHNKRIPMLSNSSYWGVFDAGYGLAEAVYDFEKLGKSMDLFIERYQFDAYITITGGSTGFYVKKDYGPHNGYLSADGNAALRDDSCDMEADEYAEARENWDRFLWSKIAARKMPATMTVGQMQDMIKKNIEAGAYAMKRLKVLHETYGALNGWKRGVYLPLETVFQFLRGMRQTSLDMRKHKDELKATLDAFFEKDCTPLLNAAVGDDYTGSIAAIQVPLLATSMLSVQQFEEMYWPHLKRTIDFCVDNQLPMFFYCEAEVLRFAEFFQEIPKGLACLELEQDDIYEARKKLPNVALAGGMPLDLLGYGTTAECVDCAKKLIDTLGDGYIMTQDKMACTRNDMKRENVQAVNDFVRNYQY